MEQAVRPVFHYRSLGTNDGVPGAKCQSFVTEERSLWTPLAFPPDRLPACLCICVCMCVCHASKSLFSYLRDVCVCVRAAYELAIRTTERQTESHDHHDDVA